MIKKTFLLLLVIALFSCKKETTKSFATFSGKITNHLGKDGVIRARDFKKEIKISADGTFSDTLHIGNEGAMYSFSDGNEFTTIYLKNGDNVHLTLDTKMFDETIKYTGDGAENNNFFAQKSLLSEKLLNESLFTLEEAAFKTKITSVMGEFNSFLNNSKGIDVSLLESEKKELAEMKKGMSEQYAYMKAEKEKYAKFIGKPSPNFENFENYLGGTTSLKDLRGKYVYVDVWATWCGPCKAEIPHLKILEEEFHGKNITFLSISVDNGRGYKDNSLALSKEGWKKMIADKKMGGVQLFSDKNWESEFVKGYGIRSIPRFILIDPKGNVVDANMTRPSNHKTKERLAKLLK